VAIVKVEKLRKTYQLGSIQLHALCDVDLEIQQGQYLAIMGPSGSGKSTLLNLLGCLDKPTSGQYWLGDKDISSLNDDELSLIRCKFIGFVFQSYNLIAQLNVIENIELPMYYQGFSETASAKQARRLAEMVGLGDRVKHRPSELSGGQQQRVAIARALSNNPAIILADEPTGNLDTASGVEILKILEGLHQEGKTVIVVTHDQEIAERAQRVIHLRDGQIEREFHNKV
jgi:putative ABC transport system ATP-binding protein